MSKLDFPGVDTVPVPVQLQRVDLALELAADLFDLGRVERNVAFDDEAVRGRYWRGLARIELCCDPDDFPGYREPAMLAHELGHAADDLIAVETGFHSERSDVFETDGQRRAAVGLSERLRGPIVDRQSELGRNYRKLDSELFADTFALRIIEPVAAVERGGEAIDRVEEVYSEFFDPFRERREASGFYR